MNANQEFREKLDLPPAANLKELEAANMEAALNLISSNEEIEALKSQLQQKERDHVTEISDIKKKAGDPIQAAIEMLQGFSPLKDQLSTAIAENIELQSKIHQLQQQYARS